MPEAQDHNPVIIIGAGAAGLAAAHALSNQAIPFTILEKAKAVGDSWRQRHPRLTMNTHRDLSALPGHRYPDGTRGFATRDQLVQHLESFVERQQLPVEFGVAVNRISRDNGAYVVSTDQGERRARHVIIASGRDRKPVFPEWQGMDRFGGTLTHAAGFGDAEDYEGKSILVVGAGNSGFDILNHLSRVRTGTIWLSVRRSPAVLPRRLMGVTVHRLSPLLARLPVPIVDGLLSISQRIAFGDITRLGFPRETEGGASRLRNEHVALVVDDGAIQAVRKGQVSLVPQVRGFCGNAVILADDSRVSPDVVIAATGYTPGLPDFMPDLDVADARGFPRINGAEQLSDYPGLWFIGMRASLLGDIGSAKLQAKAIARAIASAR